MPATALPSALLERILERLQIPHLSEISPETLKIVYGQWCHKVPFDNVQKLIHVRHQKPGPLPGTYPVEYFESWLTHGTGGTCWAGSTALHALLTALGFQAERGLGTMLIAPDIPPNHGTVRVRFGDEFFLVDSSILHKEPFPLKPNLTTQVNHPAWGGTCNWRNDRWQLHWRPLHMTDGFECRFEGFGFEADEFVRRYEQTRVWSPFNYQLYSRINRGNEVIGTAFGNSVALKANGLVVARQVGDQERIRILIEDFGMSEEIVSQLPADVATPPPPNSRTAAEALKQSPLAA